MCLYACVNRRINHHGKETTLFYLFTHFIGRSFLPELLLISTPAAGMHGKSKEPSSDIFQLTFALSGGLRQRVFKKSGFKNVFSFSFFT